MKTGAKINGGHNQLRWVVLLLAVAVILPTAGLLWFIGKVVSNERLVVRQKLIAVYKEQLEKTLRQSDKELLQYYELLDNEEIKVHPYQKKLFALGRRNFAGLLVYGADGRRIYPLLSSEIDDSSEFLQVFSDAWELEFIEHKFSQAAEIYDWKAMSGDGRVRLAGLIGKSRCLVKLGEPDRAIAACKQVAFSDLEKTAEPALLVLIGNARLLLLNLTQQNAEYSELFNQVFDKLASMVYSVNEAGFALPADHNLFLAQKLVEMSRNGTLLGDKMPDFERLIAAEEVSIRASDKLTSMAYSGDEAGFVLPNDQKLFLAQKLAEIASKRALPDDIRDFNLPSFERLITTALEELSVQTSESFPEADRLEDIKKDKLQCLPLEGETFYGIYHKTNDISLLALLSKQNIASIFDSFETDFRNSGVAYRIIDESGRFAAGTNEFDNEPFVSAAIGGDFPGWKIELSFKAGDVFERAASQRVAVYIWTGVLVIVLIFIAAVIAAQVVRKQMKLNRLKNDFIATVSHELKTPLASIRLLVDTLLEGSYKDEQQAVEYFQMVSKENERLTRLIDNFLTFSRMERNKKAFRITGTSPADIALAAAEAVKPKFKNSGRCDFQVQIADALPDVLADCDAMATVLINLLDNAYKYSYDDKKIELKVFSEDNLVCFSVKDNGIGMARRQARKIFDRFYQVDSSLSRRAEGTGLGLSSVKFIVDAHKGTISVDSRPGEGSTFTVKLPVAA